MSNAALKWATPLPLPKAPKAVLLNLADKAHPRTGRCFPCLSTIARETGFCTRAIRFALRHLESCGLIRTQHQVGRRSIYWVMFGRDVQSEPSEPPPPPPQQLDLGLSMPPAAHNAGEADQDSGPPGNPKPDKESLKEQPPENQESARAARAHAPDPLPRRSILPADWAPSPLAIAFALSCGLNDVGPVVEKFVDKFRALGAVRADWTAEWRNWCRNWCSNAARFAPRRKPTSDAFAAMRAAIDAHEASTFRGLSSDVAA